ncbi:MAG: hypothetical protein ACI9U2_002851 [Bradymonadia bacterium]|jgi:hypothetical protein
MRSLRYIMLAIGALLTTACGGQALSTVPLPGPALQGANLNGAWYSEEFGTMKVVQDGQNIRGSYEDPRGPDHNGTFKGVLQGDLIKLEWIKRGNPIAAIPSSRGRGWLRVRLRGERLEGKWGYDESRDDGGNWTAEKSKYN